MCDKEDNNLFNIITSCEAFLKSESEKVCNEKESLKSRLKLFEEKDENRNDDIQLFGYKKNVDNFVEKSENKNIYNTSKNVDNHELGLEEIIQSDCSVHTENNKAKKEICPVIYQREKDNEKLKASLSTPYLGYCVENENPTKSSLNCYFDNRIQMMSPRELEVERLCNIFSASTLPIFTRHDTKINNQCYTKQDNCEKSNELQCPLDNPREKEINRLANLLSSSRSNTLLSSENDTFGMHKSLDQTKADDMIQSDPSVWKEIQTALIPEKDENRDSVFKNNYFPVDRKNTISNKDQSEECMYRRKFGTGCTSAKLNPLPSSAASEIDNSNDAVRLGEVWGARSPNGVCMIDNELSLNRSNVDTTSHVYKQEIANDQLPIGNAPSPRTMVRFGEYSPLNPSLIPPGKPLLGLGEYEERRRQLIEYKKKMYHQQMSEARLQMKCNQQEEGPKVVNSGLSYCDKRDSSVHFVTQATQTELLSMPTGSIPQLDFLNSKLVKQQDESIQTNYNFDNGGTRTPGYSTAQLPLS